MEYRGLPSGTSQQNDTVSHQPGRLLRLLLSQADGKPRGAADTQQQGNGQTYGRQRIGYIGGRIAQISHALADKDLIHNVI